MAKIRLLVLLAVAILHGAVSAQQQPDTLSGRVTDAESGAPIRGARIGTGLLTLARTDEAGAFEIPLANVVASLQITKPGYARQMLGTMQRPSSPLQVRLVRGAALTLHVIDQTGAPAVGRSVRVRCGNSGQGVTVDPAGQVRLAFLQPGVCELSFEQPYPPLEPIPTDPAGILKRLEGLPQRARQIADARRASTQTLRLNPGDDLAFAVVAPGGPARPQQPPGAESPFSGPSGTGTIEGRIVGPGGRPAAGVRVQISGASGRASTLTDDSGAYAFAGLPADRFRVRAAVSPLGGRAYGQTPEQPSGVDISLEEGQRLQGIDVVFTAAVISGYVYDEHGEPAEGARVAVLPVGSAQPDAGSGPVRAITVPAGARAVTTVTLGAFPGTVDDRGAYRLLVPPGVYHVSATFGNDTAYFYPAGTMPSHATPVDVRGDRDAVGIDIHMRGALLPPVRGSVFTASGVPAAGGTVTLSGRALDGSPLAPLSTSIKNDGGFALDGVVPGEYLVSATVQPAPYVIVRSRNGQPVDATPAPTVEYAQAPLSVGAEAPPPLALRGKRPSSISGTVVVDGGTDGVSPSTFRLLALSGRESGSGAVDEEWRFELTGLTEPTRVVLSGLRSDGWWLRSLLVDGVNVAEHPIAMDGGPRRWEGVTAHVARTARLEGRVIDQSGSAASSFTVVAFAVDPARRFDGSQWMRTAGPDQGGAFQIDLPPGDYWVVALDRRVSLTETVLGPLTSAATRVQVGAAQSDRPVLQLVQLPR